MSEADTFAYPDLIKRGTTVGPVTPKMRARCQELVREANRKCGLPENSGMALWPDFLARVRAEMATVVMKEGESEYDAQIRI